MATLQTIRNRAGVLISIVIGLALLSFILSDLVSNNSLFNSGNKTEVAEVAGEAVPIALYEEKVNELIANYQRNTGKDATPDEETSQSIRDQAWEGLITDYVLANNLGELGITVNANELQDMVVGNNIDPQVLQIPIFKNEQTGQFDPNLVKQFLANMDKDETGAARLSWVAFEKQLEHSRLLSKYYSLVKKGLYVTSAEAKQYSEEASNLIDIRFAMKKYSDVSDSTIAVKDEEIDKYYIEHTYLFDQEASRDIDYVVFDVLPSPSDIEKIRSKMEEIKIELITTTEIADFVNRNSDVPYAEQLFAKSSLTPPVDSLIFAAQPGFVYGPYVENNVYKLARLMSFKNMADSVNARHILIGPNEKRTKDQAKLLSDSIKSLIDKGGDFAMLAMQYSDDKGSAQQGGDLKWFKPGMMVKPFEKAAFDGKKGDVVIAETQFGFHIINVIEKSAESNKAEIAYIDWQIEPSSETYQGMKTKVYQFAGTNTTKEKFEAAIIKENLQKKVASNLRDNDRNIAGLESPREIIRWAYKEETKKGEVSQPFEFQDKFVVAFLTEIREKGTAPKDQIKDQLTSLVRKDKKAETFITELKNASSAGSIDGLAQKLNLMPQDATAINFNSFSLPGVGIEPNVVATSCFIEKGKLSKPIKGNNGVFILTVTNKAKAPQPADEKMAKMQLVNEVQSRVDYQAFEALKKLADIKDYRSTWY
jgi:peptidyl-prolyl cis-trans isomerase D